MFNPSEELLAALLDPAVSAESVFEYLEGQAADLDSTVQAIPSTREFFKPEDLDAYNIARHWWPKSEELPPALALPSLFQLCWGYQHGPTFSERLNAKAGPVIKWIQEQGLEVDNPNETAEERKARLNRDAQKRHRERAGKAGSPEAQAKARLLKTAYDNWQALCKQRDEEIGLLDAKVAEAEKTYHSVCAERKAVKANWSEIIGDALAQYTQLKRIPAG